MLTSQSHRCVPHLRHHRLPHALPVLLWAPRQPAAHMRAPENGEHPEATDDRSQPGSLAKRIQLEGRASKREESKIDAGHQGLQGMVERLAWPIMPAQQHAMHTQVEELHCMHSAVQHTSITRVQACTPPHASTHAHNHRACVIIASTKATLLLAQHRSCQLGRTAHLWSKGQSLRTPAGALP